MCFQDLLSQFWGGDDQGWDAKEMEKHQRSIFVGKKAERAMWERAKLMEISNDGELRGRWRLVGFLGSCHSDKEKDSRSQEKKRED